jgi:hypothetical protein
MTLVTNDQMRGGLDEVQRRERFESFTDPLARLEAHLRNHPYLERGEQEALAARRNELEQGLRELERRADALAVPHGWRVRSNGGEQ